MASARAFWSVAFGVFVVFMASAIPTPLYPLYQAPFGFSGLMLTAIFALYVVGTLAVLVLAGNLSDLIGRRPVLLLGLAAALAGSVAFLFANGITGLLVGRLLHGVAVGVFGAAGAATLLDLEPNGNRSRAALFATVANMAGLVAGSLLAGGLAQYAPLPFRLVWLLELAALAAASVLIWRLPNDRHPAPPGWWRPRPLHMPASMRRLFTVAATAGFSISAIMGLFLSVVPVLLSGILHVAGAARGGAVVALLFTASALSEILFRHLLARVASSAGLGLMLAGLAAVIIAERATSMPLFIVGTLLAGAGQGLALMGVLAAVNLASPPEERGETISSLYVFNYLGLSLPVLGIGAASSAMGLFAATVGFAVLIGAASLFALAGLQRIDGARHPDMPVHHGIAGCPRMG